MKDIKVLISSILIIVSFFLWYLFATTSNQYQDSIHQWKKIYVDVETKGKKITLNSENDDVILLLNWQETASGTIILE